MKKKVEDVKVASKEQETAWKKFHGRNPRTNEEVVASEILVQASNFDKEADKLTKARRLKDKKL